MNRHEQNEIDRLRAELVRARAAASTDDLTGLGNRRQLRRTLAEWVARGAPFAVIIFDLANLHTLNKTRGHAGGDAALRQVADAIRSETDHVVATRHGGDEFAVLLPDCLLRDAECVRDRIEQTFGTAPITERASVFLAGAATTWHPGDDLAELLRQIEAEAERRKSRFKRDRGEAVTRAEAEASA